MADNNNAALSDALGTKMDPIARYEKSTREAGLAEQKLAEDTARIKQEAISPLIKQEQEFRDVSAKKSADVGAQLQQQFKIPEATMGDFAQLGGLIAVMGPMLGAAGKQSANVALGAMTGILDGYQKGRKDVIEQSYKQFDTNMKRLQALQKQIDSELTAYTEKMKLGREDALLHAESAVALARGGVAEKLIAGKSAGDILKAQQTLQQMGQSAQQHRERIEMEKKRLEAQDRRAELDRQLKKDIADSKAQSGGAALPKDQKTKNEYQARYQTIKNAEDILSLIDDPQYAKLIGPQTKFTPDFIANMRKNYPELAGKLARINAIEFQIGGKALTAAEQKILEPIYGWRGLTRDALKDRLTGIVQDMNQTNDLTEQYYPGLTAIREKFDSVYEKTGKVPPLPNLSGNGQQSTSTSVSSDSVRNEQSDAVKKFGKYDPDTYNYGYDEKGFYREKK